ncbi:hypothetical protein ACJJTC_010443 [Scirpophaga incertulas]
MIFLNVAITKLLKAVEACSSNIVVQWLMRILAISQAFTPAGWPPDYHVIGSELFDFVVVGSGSAGAVVAARLSEVPQFKVLLIEAGGNPPLASVVPSLFTTLIRTEYDWDYSMIFGKDVGKEHYNQMTNLIRGKMLGGTSSLNFEMYARGEPRDYDEWTHVAPGWSWQEVLHYFKKLENMTDDSVFRNHFNSYLHSTEGPVKISRPHYNKYFRHINELLLRSYNEMGLRRTLEMNGFENLGVSIPHFTFADGRRSSTAESYLVPAKDRHNLYVAKHTRAIKVLIDLGTKKAYGVDVLLSDGKLKTIYAKREVILSAGSIDTPKLLMLSGIGPKEELYKHDIYPIIDAPVGKNLHDHVFVPLLFSAERGIASALQHVISATELNSLPAPSQNGFINLNRRDGRRQLQFVNVHVGAFASPVIQIACLSSYSSYKREFCSSIAKANVLNAIDCTLLILLHPLSRGQVHLKSANPLDDPIITSGFLDNEYDIDVLVKGVRFLGGLTNTTLYKSVKGKLEKLDVHSCKHLRTFPDKYWRCYVRNTVASMQHPVGTCAMGINGVVDEKLRVHGIRGLRVVDASVMPFIPGGNTNIPTIMIGERASDFIKHQYGIYM